MHSKFDKLGLVKFFLNPYLIPFFTSFALVAFYIFPSPNIISGSGDAQSIWQTITTFRNDKITSSYVLYKGFLSVYPYVWFYELSTQFKLDHLLLIKIYHTLLFSLTAAIGIPYIVSKILNVKMQLYKNMIFVIGLFYMTKFTGIYEYLMIDLPSWAFFIAAIVFSMLSAQQKSIKKKVFLFISGTFIGLTLCSSGQYALAGYFLVIYVFVSLTKEIRSTEKLAKINLIILFSLFIAGISIPKTYDSHFETRIVQPMRDNGEWILTGKQWLTNGMTRLMPYYKKFKYPEESNRGLAILKRTEGGNFAERYELIKQGGFQYSVIEYLSIIKSNSVDFGVMWATKTFIAISFDGGLAKISHLFISYTSLFICLSLVFLNVRQVRDLVNPYALVILSIISTIAAPVFLVIEMRYIISLYGFLLGFAIYQNIFFCNLNRYIGLVSVASVISKLRNFKDFTIPYPLIAYIAFLIFCFTLYGSLLEIPGSDPDKVLYRW